MAFLTIAPSDLITISATIKFLISCAPIYFLDPYYFPGADDDDYWKDLKKMSKTSQVQHLFQIPYQENKIESSEKKRKLFSIFKRRPKETKLVKKENDLSIRQKEELQKQVELLTNQLPMDCKTSEASEFKEIFADGIRNLLLQNVSEEIIKELLPLTFGFKRVNNVYSYLYFPFLESKRNICELCNGRNISFGIQGAIICNKNGFNKVIHHKINKGQRIWVCQNCGSYLFQKKENIDLFINSWTNQNKSNFLLNIKNIFLGEIKKRI
jgi:Zn-finger protein